MSAVQDFRICFIFNLPVWSVFFTVLFPEEKVPLFCRFRKFINQNVDIVFPDIDRLYRDLPLRRASATPMKSLADCGNPDPLRQTMPT